MFDGGDENVLQLILWEGKISFLGISDLFSGCWMFPGLNVQGKKSAMTNQRTFLLIDP